MQRASWLYKISFNYQICLSFEVDAHDRLLVSTLIEVWAPIRKLAGVDLACLHLPATFVLEMGIEAQNGYALHLRVAEELKAACYNAHA
eukprot:1157253-Pelagomonas_calceolata.AAC.4